VKEREFEIPGVLGDEPVGRAVTEAFDAALLAAGITSSRDAACMREHSAVLMSQVIHMHDDHRVPLEAIRKLFEVSVDSYAAWLKRRGTKAS